MLNHLLQTLFLSFAALLLTTGIAFSSPLPSGMLMAEHTPDHDALVSGEVAQPTPPKVQPSGAPVVERDRAPTGDTAQPTQANPAVPYDPYDYKVMRKINREIYGEVKDRQK